MHSSVDVCFHSERPGRKHCGGSYSTLSEFSHEICVFTISNLLFHSELKIRLAASNSKTSKERSTSLVFKDTFGGELSTFQFQLHFSKTVSEREWDGSSSCSSGKSGHEYRSSKAHFVTECYLLSNSCSLLPKSNVFHPRWFAERKRSQSRFCFFRLHRQKQRNWWECSERTEFEVQSSLPSQSNCLNMKCQNENQKVHSAIPPTKFTEYERRAFCFVSFDAPQTHQEIQRMQWKNGVWISVKPTFTDQIASTWSRILKI